MRPLYYILVDGQPVATSRELWARWMMNNDRRIALDEFGEVRVSSVFLGLDHSFGHGPPILYETMIFGGEHDQWQARAATRDEILLQHRRACALVRGLKVINGSK